VLRGAPTTRRNGERGWAGGPYYPTSSDCATLTTADARSLARALDDAGIERDDPGRGLAYTFDVPGPSRESGGVIFEPLLPDGRHTSFRTG
jgi:hypothetical protein